MADVVIDRMSVQIEGDSSKYNNSIDTAVAKTKQMQVQQKKLVENLVKNEEAQKKLSLKIEESTQKYGKNSDEVKKLKDKMSDLTNGYKSMTSQLNSLNKDFDRQQKELAETATQADRAKNSMSGFVRVIATAASGYAGKKFLEATIGGLAQFEQYETSFAVMLGDMGKAKALIGELQDFATKTPFEMTDVTKVGTLLMNYGVEAEKLIPTMTQLGNLSQGRAEKLDRISLAYGQMLAKGKVTGEELRQMTENGVPLNQALADSIGVSTAELAKLLETGSVGIPQLNAAIESLTTGNGKFAGMMEKQSKTLIGMWSTAKDEIGSIAREMGEDAFVEIKDGLSDVMGTVREMRESGELSALAKDWGELLSTLTKGFVGLTKGMIENKETVGLAIAAYGAYKVIDMARIALTNFKKAQEAATVAQAAFNAVSNVNPYVLLATAIMGTTVGITQLVTSTKRMSEETERLQSELDNIKINSIGSVTDELLRLDTVINETVPKMEELRDVSNRTATEKELLQRYIEELNTVLGYEAASINEVTGKLDMNTKGVLENVSALQKKLKLDAIHDKIIEKEQELTEILKVQDMLRTKASKDVGMDHMLVNWITNQNQLLRLNADIEKGKDAASITKEYIKKLWEEFNTLSSVVAATGNTIADFWTTTNSEEPAAFVTEIKAMSDTLQTLTSAQKEYADSNTLSVSTLESLAKQYPDLSGKIDEYIAGLIGVEEVTAAMPTLYETEKQKYVDTLKTKLSGSEAFYKQNILSQSSLVSAYNQNYTTDLGNFKTLAEAKGNVEQTLISALSDAWAEYYNSVGGNATKTVIAMQQQLNSLNSAKNSLSISMDANAKESINQQIIDIQEMMQSLKPLQELENIEMNVDFSGIETNLDALFDKVGTKAKSGTEKVEDILKDTYDKQLKIAQDYLTKRKKQLEEEHSAKVKKINEGFDADKRALDSWYNREKEQVKSSLNAINELIDAKRKARDDVKLDDSFSFAQNRLDTLKRQIIYARTPEDKAELEKELVRQQEELKDLALQKEVSGLESQKKTHEDELSKLEERYKTESDYIKERREEQLTAIEDAKEATLTSIETTFTQFSDELATTYGYVNNETLAIGQRFANATVGAIEGGFTTVANKSSQVMNTLLAQVQEKINQMNAMVNRIGEQYAEYQNRANVYRSDNYDNRDNRSMNVTNNITRGLTEGQVSRMMQRQADDFLYKRR